MWKGTKGFWVRVERDEGVLGCVWKVTKGFGCAGGVSRRSRERISGRAAADLCFSYLKTLHKLHSPASGGVQISQIFACGASINYTIYSFPNPFYSINSFSNPFCSADKPLQSGFNVVGAERRSNFTKPQICRAEGVRESN